MSFLWINDNDIGKGRHGRKVLIGVVISENCGPPLAYHISESVFIFKIGVTCDVRRFKHYNHLYDLHII